MSVSGSLQAEMAACRGVVPVSGSWTEAEPGVLRKGLRAGRLWFEEWRIMVWVVVSIEVLKAGSSMLCGLNGVESLLVFSKKLEIFWRGRRIGFSVLLNNLPEHTSRHHLLFFIIISVTFDYFA